MALMRNDRDSIVHLLSTDFKLFETRTKSEALEASWQCNVVNELVENNAKSEAPVASCQRYVVKAQVERLSKREALQASNAVTGGAAHTRTSPFGLGANPRGLSTGKGAET